MKPLISIVIPSHNNSVLLEAAIKSIIFDISWREDIELCISDNSAGSDTENLVRNNYSHCKQIIYRRSLDAPSLDENVNMAISMANGEYVWIFGDDDLMEKDFLSHLFVFLKSFSPDILILNSSSFEVDGQVESSRCSIKKQIVYGLDADDAFLMDHGGYLTYVGCIVIRKDLWMKSFQMAKIGSYFAHIDAVFRAKIGHTAYFCPMPAIKMRLHTQTWTARHFEIWNVFFPNIIWQLDGYSSLAKRKIIERFPLKSITRILAARAYGRFDYQTFKSILWPSSNSSFAVKLIGCGIAIAPRDLFRVIYIFYIKLFRRRHTLEFSPKLALAQLRRPK